MMEGPRTAIVAVDSNDTGREVFQWYVDNVYRPGDLPVIVHCPEVPLLSTIHGSKSAAELFMGDWSEIIKTSLMKANAQNPVATPINELHYKLVGEQLKSPGEGILHTAREENADFIVMGTGLGTVKCALLGSTSDYVLCNSRIPTLIIPITK